MSDIILPNNNIALPKENIKRRVLFDSKGSTKADGKRNHGGGGVAGTRILIRNLDSGEVQDVTNKVIISGSQFTAMKHWGLSKAVDFPSYNKSLSLDNSVYTEKANDNVICLFCIGNAGCGTELSDVYDVNYTKRIQPSSMIPFRYQLPTNDLSAENRAVYFGRKTNNDYISYYFKKPETDPVMYPVYVDGTLIDQNIYDSANLTEAEFYVETTLKIDKADARDYFINTTGINSAKVNQVSLCEAWYTTDATTGYKYFQEISPVTQLNFSSEPLIDVTKGVEIIYQVYY